MDSNRPGSELFPFDRRTLALAGAIFLLALALRAYLASALVGPMDNDSTDYFLVARNLAQGRGFVEEVVGYFQPAPAAVLHASHDHWMPLATILSWLSLSLFGESFLAAQLPNLLLGAAVPVLGLAVARELGSRLPYALLAGLLLAVWPRYIFYSLDTEAVMPYVFFGGLAFLGAVRGGAGKPAWLALAGMAAGLCYLSRNDGSLWVPTFVVIYLLGLRDRAGSPARLRHWLGAAAGCLLVTAPWLARNYAVFGSPFPPGMSQVMFYRDYSDVFNFEKAASFHTYLAQGAAAILKSKAVALVEVLRGVVQDGVVHWALAPLMILGIVRAAPLARRVLLAHLAISVMVWSLLLDALAGPFGGTIRTIMLLAIYLVPAVLLGLDRVDQGLRKRWPVPVWIFPALALALTGGLGFEVIKGKPELIQSSQQDWASVHQLGQVLKQMAPPRPTVMSFQPWHLNLAEDLPAVSIPSNGLSAILAAARRYKVELLVLEDFQMRDMLGYRAESAYLQNLAREYEETGRSRDPDFIPAASLGQTLIFRVAPARSGSEPKGAP